MGQKITTTSSATFEHTDCVVKSVTEETIENCGRFFGFAMVNSLEQFSPAAKNVRDFSRYILMIIMSRLRCCVL